jgi:hypothetical protein
MGSRIPSKLLDHLVGATGQRHASSPADVTAMSASAPMTTEWRTWQRSLQCQFSEIAESPTDGLTILPMIGPRSVEAVARVGRSFPHLARQA